jgi:hypothetical protein
MIICPDIKVAFCHVPKTGGSSIAYALKEFSNTAPEVGYEYPPKWTYLFHEERQMHADPINFKKLINEEGYKLVIGHRNPYERMLVTYSLWPDDKEFIEWICSENLLPERKKSSIKYSLGLPTTWIAFETLHADWSRLRLTIPALPELPHINKRKKRQHIIHKWSQQEVESISAQFADDIEAFGYTAPSVGSIMEL